MNKQKTINIQPTALVIGGHGFIGRYVVKHLQLLGAKVIVGTRHTDQKNQNNNKERQIALHKINSLEQWEARLCNVDIVVNAVGILRQRPNETYEKVHHHAIALLAAACARKKIRWVHISALGLKNQVKSRFISSKLRGEEALKSSHADWAIVRPSLVDGNGGFGAKWFRRVAQWPVHIAPSNAKGLFAPINVDDLGEATARVSLQKQQENTPEIERIYELGGNQKVSILEHLQALRSKNDKPFTITVPAIIARIVSHAFDVLHITPYSFGHYELLKQNNYPEHNRLYEVLGRSAKVIGDNSNESLPEHGHSDQVLQQ